MLQKLESLACFLAALLALLVEGCFVYWMWTSPLTPRTAGFSGYGGQWMSPTLPQCWLLGAVVALFYYLCRTTQSDPQKAVEGRRTFLRIWYWFLALASVQGCALYLNYFTLVHR
jgi:hypothetical protein